MDFRYNRHFKAQPGGNGGTKGMTGASAEDRYIKVPQGTTVKDVETGEVLGDLLAAATFILLHQLTQHLNCQKMASQVKSESLS